MKIFSLKSKVQVRVIAVVFGFFAVLFWFVGPVLAFMVAIGASLSTDNPDFSATLATMLAESVAQLMYYAWIPFAVSSVCSLALSFKETEFSNKWMNRFLDLSVWYVLFVALISIINITVF